MTSKSPVAKNLIIPLAQYPHLKDSQTLADAIGMLYSFTCGEHKRFRYSEILILNDQGQLAGRVTLQDLLKAYDARLADIPKVQEFEGKGAEFPNLAILWEESFFKRCAKQGLKPIGEFMSPIKNIAKATDPVLKVLSIMLAKNETVLPVIENDEVIGLIRIEEIFKSISEQCSL